MNHSCYILFSPKLDRFYIGSTSIGAGLRLSDHINDKYGISKFTHKAKDWVVFLEIECSSASQARKIETHIKSMKSKVYIKNLKQYPEMIEKLVKRFDPENLDY